MGTDSNTMKKGKGSENQTGCSERENCTCRSAGGCWIVHRGPALTEDTHACAQKPPPKRHPYGHMPCVLEVTGSTRTPKPNKQNPKPKQPEPTHVYFPEATAPDFASTSLELAATSPDGTALMAMTGALHRTQGSRTDQPEASELQFVWIQVCRVWKHW